MLKKLVVLASLTTLGLSSFAQAAFPSRPMKIVVTAQPGGGGDFIARVVAQRMSKNVGQPVIVENRPGASGAIGLGEVAKAPPDGYTIALTIGDSLINNVVIFKSLSYDPRTDFAFITQTARSPALLSANTELGVSNMEDFKKLVAKQSQKLSYGSWGSGGLGHLAGEAFNQKLNAGMVHVPQRGEAPVIADLLSHTISVGLASVGTSAPLVRSGKLVPLAIMGRERSPVLPEVPTMRELGFEDPIFDAQVWLAFVAPAKTPPAIVKTLANEIRKVVAMPEVQAQFAERALDVMNTTPEQFATSYRTEFDVITKRLKQFGVEPQ